MAESVLDELVRYVRFDEADAARLRALHPLARQDFERIAGVFYQRILDTPGAALVLQGGESRVGQLRVTLVAWMESLLRGPWDDAYWEQRHRIGRVHVRIGLPQHYMFAAMNVVRGELDAVTSAVLAADPALPATRAALGKIIDLELAVMLHSYREDLLAQQARVERLSTFGQLVGSIAHDLRNPLGVIETSLYILRGRVGGDERALKHADRIEEQLVLANGIIARLLDMIRDRPLARQAVRLSEVAAGALAAVGRPPGVAAEVAGLEALPPVEGDPVQLHQVLVNLVENAVHAASPEGLVALRGRAAGGAVLVDVEDTGPGVDPATRRRLFEPLVTTKERGIGLGLALVRRIVERHGGTIEYSDREGGGARFTLRLPAGPG